MPATFTKKERLSSFKEINALVKEGNTFFHYPFRVTYRQTGKISADTAETAHFPAAAARRPENAILISVPKKNFKRAVKRNQLKRRIRESYRLNKSLLHGPEKIHFLLVYISKNTLEYKDIEPKIKEILVRISDAAEKGA